MERLYGKYVRRSATLNFLPAVTLEAWLLSFYDYDILEDQTISS